MIKLFITFFMLSSYLHSDFTIDFIRAYVHGSEMQRRSALSFIAPHLQKLSGDESILDIGCGDGRISADVSAFVPEGMVIGIDPSSSMVTWAKKQYPPLEYPFLSFQRGEFLKPNLTGSFDLILSTYALQHCADPVAAFRIMQKLLKPQGKLLLLLHTFDNEAWNEAMKTLRSSSKWSSYFENHEIKKPLTLEEYEELLYLVHLEPLKIKKRQTLDPFIDRQEFLQFLLGSFTPPSLLKNVKKTMEFHNELIDEYLRLLPSALKADGVIEARLGRIEIEAVNTFSSF